MDSREETLQNHDDEDLNNHLETLFNPQNIITLNNKEDFQKFFKSTITQRSSTTNGASKAVRLEGTDFNNPDESYKLLKSAIESSQSKKRIIQFNASFFVVQMPVSDEHAQTSYEMLNCFRRAIKRQVFGLTSEFDEIPVRLSMHQEGFVALPGCRSPVIEPDFKIGTGRGQIPFLLGEVGVSDRLEYTKLKSKLWIERGGGAVRFSIAVKVSLDNMESRNVVGLKVFIFETYEEVRVFRRLPRQQVIVRKANLIQQDLTDYFSANHNPPTPPPSAPPPKLIFDAHKLIDCIPGVPRPLPIPTIAVDLLPLVHQLL